LKQLINDIGDTVDPFERAKKAADLFGARAGARLGQALGGAHIDDYTKSLEGAEGATEKAAEAIESTFSARVQLAIKAVTAKITEFGEAFGPALTGLASLAFLGKALGLDVIVAKAFGALAGSAVVKAAVARAASAAATLYLEGLYFGDKIG